MPESPPSPCPDEDVLVAFSEGRLPGDVQNRTIQHLGGCDACLAAVGSVDSGRPTVEIPQHPITAFAPHDMVAGRYEVQRFVARGGMGEVYEAEDKLLGVRVALKTVLLANGEDPRAIAQIRREVQVARAINHPGVCRVFDLGEHINAAGPTRESKRFFLTMEFLDGSTLGQRIRTGGPLHGELLLAIARQLAEGLTAAHEVGVVHRDFKSDNVMLMPSTQGGIPRAVIMDFGLARGGPTATAVASTGGIMVGSAAYMAPEQVEGSPVREAADIYSYGVVLFEISTGRLPFLAPTAVAMATKRLFESPPAPRSLTPTLDVRLEQIILRCLARRAEDRFPSMKEVRAAVVALEASEGSSADSAATVAPKNPASRLPWLLAAGGIAVGAVAGLIMMKVSEGRRDVQSAARREAASAQAKAPPAAQLQVPTPPPTLPVPVPVAAAPAAAVPPSSPAAAAKASARPSSVPAAVDSPTKKRTASRTPAGKVVAGQPAPTATSVPAEKAADPAEPKPAEADPPSQSPLDGFANPFR
ncbi:MAG TPA: serine/threonine-protein kinase [Polyangia bacterium]|jgi:hypothetical protein|nr:serine/threonine-protein kinase [Polyangia bacterium]